jgi:N-acetylneuraminic acid mutarotase
MAYDAESDRVILFLGAISEAGNYFDLDPWSETWTYDFDTDTWTNMEPVEAPYGLRGPRMVYDAESDRMILFGGWEVGNSTKGGAFEEVWAYDYNTNTWTKMDPKVSPPGRNYHAMAYDAESDRVILWGGDGPVPVDVRSVWSYDYNTDLWEELESSGAPAPIAYGAMVYSTAADRIFLYAGLEFWSFDYNTNTWAQLSDSPMPGNLLYQAMAYIGKSDRIILYGGGPNLDFHKDNTWVYDLNTNTWTDVTMR